MLLTLISARFRRKINQCSATMISSGKIARNHEGVINNCYWYCVTTACKASLRYSINTQHPNLDANHDGLGPGIVNIVFATDHSHDVCIVTPNDISKRIARTEIINQAAAGKFVISKFDPFIAMIFIIILIAHALYYVGELLNTAYGRVINPIFINNPELAGVMSTAHSLKSAYSRSRLAHIPPLPINAIDMLIPEAYRNINGAEG